VRNLEELKSECASLGMTVVSEGRQSKEPYIVIGWQGRQTLPQQRHCPGTISARDILPIGGRPR